MQGLIASIIEIHIKSIAPTPAQSIDLYAQYLCTYCTYDMRVVSKLQHQHWYKNFSAVFWGGREGYQSLLNTDVRRELDHMGQFFKMAADYKKKIGFTGQLLIEPKPKEPMKHQYDYG